MKTKIVPSSKLSTKSLRAEDYMDSLEEKDTLASGYVTVAGSMTVSFSVELPTATCDEPVACEDPAVEAAMQAVSQYINTYIWGEEKSPAVVHCEVTEEDVEIDQDDRKEI